MDAIVIHMDETRAAETAITTVIREAMATSTDANTLEKLADKSGMPYSTLSRKMNHRPDLISWNELGQILTALGMSLVDFSVKVERARMTEQVA